MSQPPFGDRGGNCHYPETRQAIRMTRLPRFYTQGWRRRTELRVLPGSPTGGSRPHRRRLSLTITAFRLPGSMNGTLLVMQLTGVLCACWIM